MKLISLDIYSNLSKSNVRHIVFNENGLSLIIDADSSISGSSIGKTTFVRCIDLCLGSSTHKDIYRDKETGTNVEVENELKIKEMYAILTIRSKDANHILKRSLFRTNDQYIDDVLYDNLNQYREKLKQIIFPDAPEDLSLRQLITKFVRLGVNEDTIFKYQNGRGNNPDYHKAYNYFFNSSRSEIRENKKRRLAEIESLKNTLNRKYHIRSLRNFYKVMIDKEKEYKDCELQFLNHNYVDDYSIIDEANLELIELMDTATREIYDIKHKINILKTRISREEEKKFQCDTEVLRVLYNDVKDNFSNLCKSFDEFTTFHNKMCNLRIALYNEELEKLQECIEKKEITLNEIRNNFASKFVDFKADINSRSNSYFTVYYDIKIEYENMKNDYKQYKDILDERNALNDEIAHFEAEELIRDEKEKLNEIFENVSKLLLDNKCSFIFNDNIKFMPISSTNFIGKIGSGDKKTLTAAVDFSFDEFFVANSMDFPRFIIHDKMELVPDVDLMKVFDYCRQHTVQYVVPIMRDKIEDLNVEKKEIVLELSKKDKLFRF